MALHALLQEMGMSDVKLIAEFLDEIKERAERDFKGLTHQAFVDWYVNAEFGDKIWVYGDGAGDAGIDAIVWLPEEIPSVCIIQSKFSRRVGAGQANTAHLASFGRVISAFRNGGEEFESMRSAAAGDLKRPYTKALAQLDGLHWLTKKKAFRFITTRGSDTPYFYECDHPDFYWSGSRTLDLYRQYRRGRTPAAQPLSLKFDQLITHHHRDRRVKSYLFKARMHDFRRYLERYDVARLVSRNIRYKVEGPISKRIYNSYVDRPDDFWFLHNGITIVCDGLSFSVGAMELANPSVVNGAQTLYAISSTDNIDFGAYVPVRVIERSDPTTKHDDDGWIQEIIRGVNTQNPIKASDFKSNEPEQFALQELFAGQHVFYERKRGSWAEVRANPRYRKFTRLAMSQLAQIAMCVSKVDGTGVLHVKRGKDLLFGDKYYSTLFPDRSKIRSRFKTYYFAYRLFRLLWNHGYRSQREYRKQRHAFWNTLWLVHRAIDSHSGTRPPVESTRALFDDFETNSRNGRKVRGALKSCVKAVWRAYRTARRGDVESWTPNNFFKVSFGNQQLEKLAYPAICKVLRDCPFADG